MNKIIVDLEELKMALDSQEGFGELFLDKQTGEIVLVSEYTDSGDELQNKLDKVADSERFVPIEPMPSHERFEFMEEFAESIERANVQDALLSALKGKKPFRSFKDALLNFPDVEKEWFAFETEQMNKAAKEWLEENDIQFEAASTSKMG